MVAPSNNCTNIRETTTTSVLCNAANPVPSLWLTLPRRHQPLVNSAIPHTNTKKNCATAP